MKLFSRQRIIRIIFILCFVIVGVLLLGEVYLRWHYGLCDAVLMQEDSEYEYIAQPSQKRRRFGNCIAYNSLSMRGEDVRKDAEKILVVGDSVVNGGTLTDQAKLATAILEERLADRTKTDIQILNISAGSWGPDNCAAYLRKHGTFGAKCLILVCSSHDARDNMNFSPVVGVHRSYPDKQYSLAYLELFDRYLYPGILGRKKKPLSFEEKHHISKDGKTFNSGFSELKDIALSNHIPFIVILHAELTEVSDGEYNSMGKEIKSYLKKESIPCIEDLSIMTPMSYRKNDSIHLSDFGQEQLANLLYQITKSYFLEEN